MQPNPTKSKPAQHVSSHTLASNTMTSVTKPSAAPSPPPAACCSNLLRLRHHYEGKNFVIFLLLLHPSFLPSLHLICFPSFLPSFLPASSIPFLPSLSPFFSLLPYFPLGYHLSSTLTLPSRPSLPLSSLPATSRCLPFLPSFFPLLLRLQMHHNHPPVTLSSPECRFNKKT